ncbi:MAG: ankyrin repeat domain-containing protein [candidate division Zixibacteria bacterium]|nr:ankyrin repeat domain-containing protein [candidate division Zixibacteria bacterium]
MILLVWATATASTEDILRLAEGGNLDSVTVLLQQDPSLLEAVDDGGYTPLHKAAYAGQTEIVTLLLGLGANINAASNSGSTPLHGAAYYGHLATVNCLVAAGADIDVLNSGGYSPLLSAMAAGQVEVARALIQLGAGVNVTTNDGKTPLMLSVQSGGAEMTKLILSRHPDLETADSYGRTALSLVARESGSVEIAALLIDAGASINAVDRFGSTPLELAAWRGFSAIVDLLLDRGARLPADPGRLNRMLTNATQTGLPRLFDLVVARGADVSARNPNDGSYLHSAAAGGNIDILQRLLRQGLPINERDKYGWTALHYAIARGRVDAARLLLDNGADINAATLAGHTPLSVARDRERATLVELLTQQGANRQTPDFTTLRGPYFGQRPPGDTVTWFAPDIVSSPRFEHSNVAFSPDGTEAFWSSSFHIDDSGYTWSRMMTAHIENGVWTKPTMASFSSPRSGDDGPFFSPDASKLYFVSMRPIEPDTEPTGHHLWMVERTPDGWSEARLASAELNEIGGRAYRSMAANGNVYADGPGGGLRSSGDIFVSRFTNGLHLPPESMGGQINSGAEEHACIAPDESYMIIQRRDHVDALGDADLFVSFRDENGNWTTPLILPEPISTAAREWYPYISMDGKYLIFNSHRGGEADYYWVSTTAVLKHRDKALREFHATRPTSDRIALRRSEQHFEPVRTNSVGLGDLDGDGDLDLVCANMGENDSRVWLNTGSGIFTATDQLLTREGHGVVLNDADGDGDLDVFITCAGFGWDGVEITRPSRLYFNDGSARFTDSEVDLQDSLASGNRIDMHDIDGDGDTDAMIMYNREDDGVYLNDGHGVFTRSNLIIPENATWGDLDGDGDIDILAREPRVGFRTHVNDGTGAFAVYWEKLDSTTVRGNIGLADLDGDGDLDAVVAAGGGETARPTEIWYNDGAGRFADSGVRLPVTLWGRFAAGDFNGDGYSDMFVTNFGLPDYMWLNDGNGKLYDTGLRLGGYGTTINPAVGDIDGDGDLDLVAPDFGGGVNVIWFNESK